MENLKVISAHGSTSTELIDVPKNTYIFYLSKLSKTCSDYQHDMTFKQLNKWLEKFKNHSNSDKRFFYRDCIMFLLFNELRSKLLQFLSKIKFILKSNEKKKYSEIKSVSEIDSFKLKKIEKMTPNEINYFEFVKKMTKKFDEYKKVKNPAQKFYLITKLWSKIGFNQFISPNDKQGNQVKICNLSLHFMPIYKIGKQDSNIEFFYSGIIPLEKLKDNTEFFSVNLEKIPKSGLPKLVNSIMTSPIIKKTNLYFDGEQYKIDFPEEHFRNFSMGQYLLLKYPKILDQVFKLSPIFKKLWDDIKNNAVNAVNNNTQDRIPSWEQLFNINLNEILTQAKYEPNGIYLISACRSFNGQLPCSSESISLSSIPKDENDYMYQLLTQLEVYQQVIDGNYYPDL